MASKFHKSFSDFKQKVSRTLHLASESSERYKVDAGIEIADEETPPPTIKTGAVKILTKTREEARIDGIDNLCLTLSDEQSINTAPEGHIVDIKEDEETAKTLT